MRTKSKVKTKSLADKTVKTETPSVTKTAKPKFVTGYKSVNKDLSSFRDPKFKYEIGKEAVVKNAKPGAACAEGIHFSLDLDYPLSFAADNAGGKPGVDFKVLKLKVNKDDILATSSSKSRASKVFVVCEEKVVLPDFSVAEKEVTGLEKSLGKIVCKATPAKIRGLFTKYCNDNKLKGLTLQIIDNPFEASHYAQRLFNGVCNNSVSLSNDDLDGRIEDLSYSINRIFGHSCDYDGLSFSIQNILTCFAKKNASPYAKCHDTKALVEMMKLGVLFLGQNKKTFVVFAPATLPNKWFPQL